MQYTNIQCYIQDSVRILPPPKDGGSLAHILVEKRVCQDMYARCRHPYSNLNRYMERRRVANQIKNIFGSFPEDGERINLAG